MKNIDEFVDLVFVINRLTKEGLESEKGSPSYIQSKKSNYKKCCRAPKYHPTISYFFDK